MILAWMICILLIGGLLCWLVSRWNNQLVKWIALIAVCIDFVIICSLCMQQQSFGGTENWFINYQAKLDTFFRH